MALRIIGTFANRILTAVLNFAIVLITAKLFGAEGRGEISLLVLSATIIQILSGIAGGGALTYLAPRYRFSQLWLISTLWCIVVNYTMMWLLQKFHLIHPGTETLLLMFALPAALFSNQQSLLLAFQRVHAYNLVSVLQPLTLLTYVWYFGTQNQEHYTQAIALYATGGFYSFMLVYFISFIFLQRLPELPSAGVTEIGKKFLFHGGWSQVANLAQLMNYRFSYYCLEAMKGISALGMFSTGVSIAESVWVYSKSLSTLQYARTVNEQDKQASAVMAVSLLKISVAGTAVLTLILILLPESLYTYLLGEDFSGISNIIGLISISILCLSAYTILASYFSGTGRHNISSQASVTGLIVTIVFCLLLIPEWGVMGAAWAMNASHLTNCTFLFYRFNKENKMSWKEWLPKTSDKEALKQVMKRI